MTFCIFLFFEGFLKGSLSFPCRNLYLFLLFPHLHFFLLHRHLLNVLLLIFVLPLSPFFLIALTLRRPLVFVFFSPQEFQSEGGRNPWVFYFNSATERAKFESVLGAAWKANMQVCRPPTGQAPISSSGYVYSQCVLCTACRCATRPRRMHDLDCAC